MAVDSFKEEFKHYKKRSTDLRDVLDLRNPGGLKLEIRTFHHEAQSSTPSSPSLNKEEERLKARALGLKPPSEWHILSLPTIPGLLLLPDLFQHGGQHYWVKQCLVDYPCKPNVCNLDAHTERAGDGCLWPLGQSAQKLSKPDTSSPPPKKLKLSPTGELSAIHKDSLLYRLRWVTLGYHYDWDSKEYCSEHQSPFPADLANLSSFILHHAGFPGFKPEAAIVNYYHLDSSLSGHTDHSEKDLSQPLLSISFGQTAIFLIGGKNKQVKPTPILLRSGDIVIMSRDARLAYHGIPRILLPSEVEGMKLIPTSLTTEAITHDEFMDLSTITYYDLKMLDQVVVDGDVDEQIIRKELSDVPLEELQRIRQKIGTKKFDSVLKESFMERKTRSFKRANKNRPSEVSSKKPVSRFREVVLTQKKKEEACDPRFDERAGKLNNDLFKKSFSFIEEMKEREKHLVLKESKKIHDPEKKEQLQRLLQQMESREAASTKKVEKEMLMREHKKVERRLIRKGKKPFHIKKSTQKKIELAQKYAKLKKSGKLERFMNKKKKKNRSRDRRQLPQ